MTSFIRIIQDFRDELRISYEVAHLFCASCLPSHAAAQQKLPSGAVSAIVCATGPLAARELGEAKSAPAYAAGPVPGSALPHTPAHWVTEVFNAGTW